jgi:hypothetical protein
LVLGPLAENRLFLSTDNYGLAWTGRPGVLAIFALTLVGILYPVFKSSRDSRKKAAADTSMRAGEEVRVRRTLHFGTAALFTLTVIVVLSAALWQSRNFGPRAGLFPWVIGIPTLILAFFQLARDVAGKETAEAAGSHAELAMRVVVQRTVAILLWIVGCFIAIWLLGFPYAIPLVILLYLKFARESWKITAIVTFCAWIFFWGLFERLLNVPFPEGLLISLIKGGE